MVKQRIDIDEIFLRSLPAEKSLQRLSAVEHVRYTGVGAQPFDGNPLNVGKAAADHLTVGFVKVRDTSHPVADQDALLYGLENGVYFHEFHYNTFGQGWG